MTLNLGEIGEQTLDLDLAQATPEGGQIQGTRAGWRLALGTFASNKLAVVGAGIVLFFLLFCFVGPHIYVTNQTFANPTNSFLPPSAKHLFGADQYGFDELGRVMKGGQAALEIGFLSSAIATVIGTIVGSVAGLFGGIVDAVLMRIVDILLSLPALFVILIVSARYHGASVMSLSLIIGGYSWLVSARLVRGEVLSLRERDFVFASQTMGASRFHLIRKHLVPNALGVVIVNITFQVADAINFLALLGFLGYGLNYPAVDWGDMLSQALVYLQEGYWWIVYPVGVCLVLVVMAFNFIGDALRDTVDVRLRRR
jgi:ABC-type dipeptide/oligopeptide/nickel transport system permease subunit